MFLSRQLVHPLRGTFILSCGQECALSLLTALLGFFVRMPVLESLY